MAANTPWHQDLARLTQAVEEWFRLATKKFSPPSACGCRMVACYVMALRDNPENAHRKFTGQTQTVRDGKRFLRHLAAESRRIEKWIALASEDLPALLWLREQHEILARIAETRRHIESLLPVLASRPDPNLDPIRLLAARAKEAWEETNGGRSPRSAAPDGPLCQFVVAALTAIGQRRSAAEVSEVLRGRRRKPKDGQNR